MGLFKKQQTEPTFDLDTEIKSAIQKIENTFETYYDENKIINLTEQQFTFCLGALASTRVVPGIDQHMGFDHLVEIEDPGKREMIAFHIQKMYGANSVNSLLEAGNRMFTSGVHYDLFYGLWNHERDFDKNKLTEQAKQTFIQCKDFARHFYPYLKDQGMSAWDTNERIGMLRNAHAARIITDEQFITFTSELVEKTLQTYHNWKEYAVACLCGATYFMFKQSNCKTDEAIQFLHLNTNIILHLIQEDRVWLDASWGYIKTPNQA